MIVWKYVVQHFTLCVGDLVIHTGDFETRSVFRRVDGLDALRDSADLDVGGV